MRAHLALAIYVSLTTGAFAESPVSKGGNSSDSPAAAWTALYEAGMTAAQQGSYEEALALFQRTWDASTTAEEQGASATDIGQVYRKIGHAREAREWTRRGRDAYRADKHLAYRSAAATAILAELYRDTGDYPEAERLLREMLREMLLSKDCDANSEALLRNHLADLLREQGRSAEARPLFEESLEQSTAAAVFWKQRVAALIGLADIDREQGDWEAAVDRWNEALRICRREQDHAAESVVLRGLGTTWLKAGDASRAAPLLRRALWITENDSDMPSEDVAGAHAGLGELYRSENKLALAENEWSLALQMDRKVLGDTHPQVAVLMQMLSEVYSARGEFSLAREYATQASDAMRSSFGDNSMPVAAALTNRATVEERAGAPAAAAQDYERAVAIARDHPEYRAFRGVLLQRYAELLKTMHRGREAKALLTQPEPEVSLFRDK
ncbi:MAG TPA: tetratricopeptide repeat protein [Bryobacteraceae bacterium]